MFNISESRKRASAFVSAIAEFLAVPDSDKTKKTLRVNHTATADGNFVQLLAEAKGLTHDGVRVSRTQNSLSIEVVGDQADCVVYRSSIAGETSATGKGSAYQLSEFGHVTWSNGFADDITAHMKQIIHKGSGIDTDFWEARTVRLARTVISALVELRDSGHLRLSTDVFKSHLHLDALIGLSTDTRLSTGMREMLTKYLDDMPGYREEDARANSLQPVCYQHHGHLMMHIVCAMSELLPPPTDLYEYEVRAPFRKVEAEITADGVLVTVFFHPNEERLLVPVPEVW